MIEDKNIQEWTEENKQLLLEAILSHSPLQDPADVCIVGSRCYGQYHENSDIDAIVYFDSLVVPTGPSPNTYHEYEGKRLTIAHKHITLIDALVDGKYHMPRYSLITGYLDEGNPQHIEEKRAKKP